MFFLCLRGDCRDGDCSDCDNMDGEPLLLRASKLARATVNFRFSSVSFGLYWIIKCFILIIYRFGKDSHVMRKNFGLVGLEKYVNLLHV